MNVTEETYYEFIKPSKLNLEKLPSNLRYFGNLTLNNQVVVIRYKQTIFSYQFHYKPMIDLAKKLLENKALYDLLCLNCAISIFRLKDKDNDLSFKVTHRDRVIKPKSLDYKIKVNLAEITILRKDGYSWDNIAKEMKHRHRTQFKDYKLSGSYLRRVYNQLTNQS